MTFKGIRMDSSARRRLLAGSIAFSLFACAVALAGPGADYASKTCGGMLVPNSTKLSCRACCLRAGLSAEDEADCTQFCVTTLYLPIVCPWYDPFCWF